MMQIEAVKDQAKDSNVPSPIEDETFDPSQPAKLHAEARLQHLIHAAFQGNSREDVTYAVIAEFLLQHKYPPGRFVLYPQLSLRWKPHVQKDRREEIPDFGVGNFSLEAPYFKMRLGIEAKRLLDSLKVIPEPRAIEGSADVLNAFHSLYYQGEDQAKAAFKGRHPLSEEIPYLLFVGPYFQSVKYGSFGTKDLGIRTLKRSKSDDYKEALKVDL